MNAQDCCTQNCRQGRDCPQRLVRDAGPDLLEALRDMLSGWRYIRQAHGDLYGVGWDRAQDKAISAIAKATGTTP